MPPSPAIPAILHPASCLTLGHRRGRHGRSATLPVHLPGSPRVSIFWLTILQRRRVATTIHVLALFRQTQLQRNATSKPCA
ncbi:hypothetical protein CC85DRAFT_178058 [Cutaneotrichosporon oleaginosum]|uniref:Uncharacterized protein n=1 Tax=Cutaneotrichosporon oleaginosum TaxID=879819 RepID=A0A0J1AWU7_9TREE|nr:uncharacterized protein CC85DRAFT_178058 [Cutaneotrichosporon oleaginosum]KLT39769.1 hypothetical protein CC85DRAFT_178058 [Cutaneotrichosporon oleaginosum]TXT05686.1 hypothetical protein COLE_07006 [Cutaneotrichosporon oleaginosum]